MRSDLLLKAVGAFGSIAGAYKTVHGQMAQIDAILIALISVLLISLGREIKKKKEKAKETVEIDIPISLMSQGIVIKNVPGIKAEPM